MKWRILPVGKPPTRRRPRRRPEEHAVGKAIKKLKLVHEEKLSLGVLIHQHVRAAVEQAVQEELAEVLGVELYERSEARRGERNGTKMRTLTGPTGPLELTLPRARLFTPGGSEEWASKLVPRYQRRVREVNESVLAVYLSGANTRRIAGALRPLLKAAPLSKSAVSRVVGTLKSELATWEKRSLVELDVARRDRAAGADGQAGDERPGAGRASGTRRRAEAARRDGDVRERVARRVEGISRRPGRPRPPSAGALHRRR